MCGSVLAFIILPPSERVGVYLVCFYHSWQRELLAGPAPRNVSARMDSARRRSGSATRRQTAKSCPSARTRTAPAAQVLQYPTYVQCHKIGGGKASLWINF